MDTQSVIVLGVGINVLIAVALVLAPRLRDRRGGRDLALASALGSDRLSHSMARNAQGADAPNGTPGPTESLASSGASIAASATTDAGAPWFPRQTGEDALGSSPSLATTDPTTSLDLATTWARWLSEEYARFQRFHRPATIVLVELAGLDRLAERIGDDAAQLLIPPIAATMQRLSRATDHVARLGPARFGAVLTETDDVRAINYIERVRTACDLWLEAGAVSLRLSIGWAETGTNKPTAVAFQEAERRLFAERQRAGQLSGRHSEAQPLEAPVGLPSST